MKLSYSALAVSSAAFFLSSLPTRASGLPLPALRHHAATSTNTNMNTNMDASSSSSLRSLSSRNDYSDLHHLGQFAEWMESHSGDDDTRQLLRESRPCGQEIGRTTASEIKQVLEIYVSEVIASGKPASQASKAREALSSLVEYDFAAIKVCISCSMITEEMLGAQAFYNQDEHGFQTYCGPESYGYDAVRIAIVVILIVLYNGVAIFYSNASLGY
jgi:hypothetical protein